MFATEYYCLVAGLKEYSLDADTKGFDAKAIVGEILDGVSKQQSWIEQFRQYENVTELTRPMVIHLIERINIFEDSNIEIVFRHRNQIEEILQFISEKTANKNVLAMPIREVG